jgi:asparagine synthase (glutamine-hydrolysing)
MCGIAGIFDTRADSEVDAAVIHCMCQSLVRRGPDDEGTYVKGGIGLGMRRLSIIDLAGGHQPIHNEDKSIWIVFNGEIFNYRELRTELKSRGHRFYTDSDTEVIVHLYEDYGADCVRKLRGMFAFAIYDGNRRRLLLARDRLGIKPLHYAFVRGRLLFGSEIKAILAAAPELSALNRGSLLQYFYLRYIPEPSTAFADVWKLPPAHILEVAQGKEKIQVQQYWDLPEYGTDKLHSEEQCLEEMEERLAEAVRIQLMSDVPLGALLSGGTDSSTVVGLMARASSRPIQTFSVGFSDDAFSETRYARVVAERFGTEHHELRIEPNIEEDVDELSRSMEEPFGDSSMLPTYRVCRMARRHVTVALSGDGGDELFGGYERFHINLHRRFFDLLPAWMGSSYRRWIHPQVPRWAYGRNFLYNVSLQARDRYLDYVSVLPARNRDRSIFTGDFLDWTTDCPDPLGPFRECYDRAPAKDTMSRLLYLETKTTLPGDMLTKVDRMSMATSLEVRVPLLDHCFVEWVTQLPVKLKVRNGKGKFIFNKLAERVGVPPEVIYRPKQGFAMPLVHWMRREMKKDLVEILLEPRTLQRGYFNPGPIRALLEEHFQGRRDNSGKIWLLLMFELWHRNFLESRSSCTTIQMPARVNEVDPSTARSHRLVDFPALRRKVLSLRTSGNPKPANLA